MIFVYIVVVNYKMIRKLYNDEFTDVNINGIGFHRNVLNLIPYFSSLRNFADCDEKEFTFDDFSNDAINFFKRWLYENNKFPKLTFSLATKLYNLSNYFNINLWVDIRSKVSYLINSNYKNEDELIEFLCSIDNFDVEMDELNLDNFAKRECESQLSNGERYLWCMYYIKNKDSKAFTLAQENLQFPWAMNMLALCYTKGIGVEKNLQKASELRIENWMKNRDGISLRFMGKIHLNYKKAVYKLWTKYKNPIGLNLLAQIYEDDGDTCRSMENYEKDWKLNFAPRSLFKIVINTRKSIPLKLIDYKLGILNMKKYECENNSKWKKTIEMAEVGIKYFNHESFYQELSFCLVCTNPERFYELQKICIEKFNSTNAKLNVAYCLSNGLGCEKDIEKALEKYTELSTSFIENTIYHKYVQGQIRELTKKSIHEEKEI